MKKALFVVDKFDMGGLQKVNSVIVNALSEKKDIKVDVYSLQWEESIYEFNKNVNIFFGEANFRQKSDIFIRKSLNKVSKGLFKRGTKIVISRQISILSKIIRENKYNTVVLNGPALLFSSNLKKIFPNIKLIMWMHNSSDKYLNSYFKENRTLLIESMRNAKVVCLTEEDKMNFSKYSDDVLKIWNPVTIINDRISELSEKTISFVGRIDIEHKGIDYLIEIASKLPSGWRISIAGNGNEKAMKVFNNLIKKYSAYNKIIYKGTLEGESLKRHYLDSSIYLMTSRWEGMPLVLAEAMSFGLPIIAFEQSGSKEVLKDGEYGILVENGDIKKMVSEINKLISDKNIRQDLQKKSLDRLKDFQLKQIINEWSKII